MKTTKNVFSLLVLLLVSVANVKATTTVITEAGGWLESAFVKWEPISGADSYSVYYSGEGVTDGKIDTQLIRSYGSYFRADVLGLKAGTYTLKVVAVDANGQEGASFSTEPLTVKGHDRSGFAFANGGAPGAYNADGTLKSGAKVIYLTPNNAKTVTLSVVTDAGKGTTEVGTGIYQILKLREKGKAETTPLAIRVIGKITANDVPAEVVSAGYIDVKATQNVTVEGIGDDATLFGWGVHVRASTNIEVRNIGVMRFTDDGISLEVDNSNIWLHNNDLFYGSAGGDSDQAKGDGALDIKTSALVTVSYNHFWDSGKSNLLGNGTESEEQLTYHHNWYDHSDSRHPRVRCHTVHVYNNYYLDVAKYGVGSTMGSSVFVEANYFENTKRPMLISMQGTDISGGKGTFSSEDGGIIKAYNNHMDAFSKSSYAPYSSSNTVEFDAYEVTSRSETVPSTVKSKQGANQYNNFDTNPSIMYDYTAEAPDVAKTNVMTYAGRVKGGDFQPRDLLGAQSDSDKPIAELSNAINSYTSKLVSIQGEPGTANPTDPDPTDPDPTDPDPTDPIGGDMICTFTKEGATNSKFTVEGDNPTTTNGPVTVDGVSYTYAWKMNSKGKVSFATDKTSTLTLVFASKNSGNRISVDGGADITIPSDGIVVVSDLPAGSHTIVRTNGESQLFYISIGFAETGIDNPASEQSMIRIYPNPVVHTLNIDAEDIQGVKIYNISGALIKSLTGDMTSVDMSNLAKGNYLVKVIMRKGEIRRIIIKK